MGKRNDNPLLHASAKSNVGHEAPRNQACEGSTARDKAETLSEEELEA